jgi:Uma2 family endonuclease
LAIEVVSDNDKSRKKLDFYASVGARELLMIDREPWQIELFRLTDGKFVSIRKSLVGEDTTLISNVVPLSLRLVAGTDRPLIEVCHNDGAQQWAI